MIKVGILTASDKGSIGERVDESGKVIENIISKINGIVSAYILVADDREIISSHLRRMCDDIGVDLILTTGGTGFSPRDNTPEATLDVVERQVPGIPEAMRQKSLEITPKAMLSRAVAGIRKKTLIINLPGSPKGVRECLEIILPVLPHAIEILSGRSGDCGQN